MRDTVKVDSHTYDSKSRTILTGTPMTTLLTYQVVFVLDAALAELLKPQQQGTGC